MTQTQSVMETTKIKLARQAVTAHEARLASATDKDTVRRQIAAAKARLREAVADQR